MARQILCINAQIDASGTQLSLTYVFWLTAPSSLVVPKPNYSSVVPAAATVAWGITAAELAALQNGTVIEVVDSSSFPASGFTPANMEANVQQKYTAKATALANSAFAGVHFVGASYDGTSWTAGP